MKNVEMSLDKDGILTIKIDTKKRFDLSGSGKNMIIASTGGNVNIHEESPVKIGINCYIKA